MIKDSVFAALELAEARRAERRRFLKLAGAGTAAAGGLALLSACGSDNNNSTSPSPTPTPTPTPTGGVTSDVAILQLALNLEYLEAQFYSFAAFGRSLPEASLTGTVGERGGVTGGRKVAFSDPIIASYAREIAADELAHVNALRAVITSVSAAQVINQPAINIDGGASGAFTFAAQKAGIIGANDTFDPYLDDKNFLLAAYLFEDVGVTAYKGASPLISSAIYLEAAAGILAAEAYHAGLIRAELYRMGTLVPGASDAITKANAISDYRDSLDGVGTTLLPKLNELDEGITKTVSGAQVANIVPADSNAIAYSRTTFQIHNIAYLTKAAATSGGFFPKGTNNSIDSLRSSGNFA